MRTSYFEEREYKHHSDTTNNLAVTYYQQTISIRGMVTKGREQEITTTRKPNSEPLEIFKTSSYSMEMSKTNDIDSRTHALSYDDSLVIRYY